MSRVHVKLWFDMLHFAMLGITDTGAVVLQCVCAVGQLLDASLLGACLFGANAL